MSNDIHTEPMDAAAVAALHAIGLRFEKLAPDDESFDYWFQAMGRGFLAPIAESDVLEHRRGAFGSRRMTGVWDDSGADPKMPIATASSWIADLTVPGERGIPSWAISTITVAPTHRRRGIARQLLESELRTAVSLGVPVAILTASDARLYSRYGFAPAAMRADWKFDVGQAKWAGPVPDGRVQLVPSAVVRDEGGFDVLERVRLVTPGQISFDGLLWDRLFGTKPQSDPNDFRVARYDDAAGTPQGFAIYRVKEDEHSAELFVTYLVAATLDAYAALWKYLLEIDLITSVTADLRPVDEPVYWQIDNPRAARRHEEGDHLWVRILDVKTALEARTYSAAGVFVLHLADPLGHADGTWLLDIAASGRATVSKLDDARTAALDDNHGLELSIVELGALYLGGTSVSTLVRAGRIRELRPGSAVAADAALRSTVTPWLSIWF